MRIVYQFETLRFWRFDLVLTVGFVTVLRFGDFLVFLICWFNKFDEFEMVGDFLSFLTGFGSFCYC